MIVEAIEVIKTSHHSVFDLGEVHLSGSFMSGTETLCGAVDTSTEYVKVNKPIACAACKEIYQAIKFSRKRIKFS